MKITKAAMKDGLMKHPVTTTLQAEVERMHSEKMLDGKELPMLMFSATFGRGGFDDVKHFTGLLKLTAVSESEQAISEWQQYHFCPILVQLLVQEKPAYPADNQA